MAGKDVPTVQNLLLASAEGEGGKMKICAKCRETFPLTDQFFGIRDDSPDGFRNDCKACVKKRRDAWHQRNREDQTSKMKEYRKQNIDSLIEKKRDYNNKNRDIMIVKCRNYYQENRVKVLAQMREHWTDNKEQISQSRKKRYRENYEVFTEKRKEYASKNREMINKTAALYCASRKQTDMEYRILCAIRTRICIAIRTSRSHKVTGTTKLLGCTISELRKHLEKQFLPGMSWDNWARDGWHIDHRIPCACFDLSFPNQQKECFNYKNLRPMWAVDNLRKGAKLDRPFQPSLSMAM